MKNISANQRTINIINRAISLGFEFDKRDTLEDIQISAEEFLIENTEASEDECEVKPLRTGQRVDWVDRKGYEYWAQGEIVDFSDNWHKDPETKVFHSTVIDSEAQVINLYYQVGQTEYNQ